jgi:quinate dehydrogenase (quinone)
MPMIGNQTLTESDMWGATPIDLLLCRIQFKEMRHQGVFTPPGKTVPCSSRARLAA